MVINSSLRRRDWLALAAASIALPANAASPPGLLTSWVVGDQAWAGIWQLGRAPRGIALPKRAHEVLLLPASLGLPGQALAVARRPGEYLLRFDTRTLRAVQWHGIEDDRVLCGHACFAPDGSALYTSETSTDTGAGYIAVRDPVNLEKRTEFPSGGLDPHMLLVEPDGTLLVANGGRLNLPETGRSLRNPGHMDSNLTRLDARSGAVTQVWRLDDPFLSLRHLARAPNGTVAVALQAEHTDAAARHAAPLLALLDGDGLRSVPLPEHLGLGGYGGDVACITHPQHGDRFAISATRSGQLAWWSTQGGSPQLTPLPAAGALAPHGSDWLASGAHGGVRGMRSAHALAQQLDRVQWDNHGQWRG
jgi:hypothetical protein